MLKHRLFTAALITVFIALLSLTILPAAALAQDGAALGTISGQVTNGTEAGGSAAGLKVDLIIYVNDVMTDTLSTETDSEGDFRFDNVDTANKYVVSAGYLDVSYYYPDVIIFEEGETEKTVAITVNETTTSDADITVTLSHAIVNVEEDSVMITEIYVFNNGSDRTYVGDNGVLFFTLPEGATGFSVPEELLSDYALPDSNHAAYLVPFAPGSLHLAHTYRLPLTGSDALTFSLEVDYPTSTFELMVAGDGVEVTASQLSPADPVVAQDGTRYIHFTGASLERSRQLDISLSGLSHGVPQYVIIIPVIVIVAAAAAIYLMRRKRQGYRHE